jgi:hypothetical protein
VTDNLFVGQKLTLKEPKNNPRNTQLNAPQQSARTVENKATTMQKVATKSSHEVNVKAPSITSANK